MKVMLIVLLLAAPVISADYYIDPEGSDQSDGRTPGTAFKTLQHVSKLKLEPGDQLLLRGENFTGPLVINGAGTKEKPILIRNRTQEMRATIQGGEYCIDASTSHVIINGLNMIKSTNPERGSIMIWASRDLEDIQISDCRFESSAGRGIWIAGEAGKKVKDVKIIHNTFLDNAGSAIQVSKLSGGRIEDNQFDKNCRKRIDQWQAAIRLWSADISDVIITKNRITGQRFGLKESQGMGIHIDEVGPGISVVGNDIHDSDSAGILVENTQGVRVENNLITNVHTGIFVYRAGHQHQILQNTINADSLGIVLQGHRAGGVDAGPEILRDQLLFTGNHVEKNIAITSGDAALKVTGGAEKRGSEKNQNIIDNNCFGEDRPYLFEWGVLNLKSVAELDAIAGKTNSISSKIIFAREGGSGPYTRVDKEKVAAGVIR